MSAIHNVAKLAGVGVGTVSRVFNNSGYVSEKTRLKVEQAIKELNYVPNASAKNLITNLTNTIALVLPTINHPLFCELAFYIEQELSTKGFKLMICNSKFEKAKELEFIKMLNEKRIDGIIFISNSDIENELPQNLPIVTIDRHFSNEMVYISSDNYIGGQLAAQHLIEKGCKKLAFISDFVHINTEVHKRKNGFIDKATELGFDTIIIDNENLQEVEKTLSNELPNIDGIFAINDILAIQCLGIFNKNNLKVPQDIKIIGYDGLTTHFPQYMALTTIKQPMEEMGRLSARQIMNIVHKVETESRHILDVELVQGTTT